MHYNLYVARRERSVTQRTVAKKLGIHYNTYCKKESGKLDFSLREAIMLSKYFNQSLDELFAEREEAI